jgi:hypothetical protein
MHAVSQRPLSLHADVLTKLLAGPGQAPSWPEG